MMQGMGVALLLAGSVAAAQTLDLERAREIDLDGMRGLGPSSTRKILEERQREPFQDWQDLMRRVPGIGPAKARDLSQQGLRVQGQAFDPVKRR